MNPEVDALHHFFAAVNRNDMQAITRDFDPQIVRIEPEGFRTAGTYRGIAAVRENVRTGRGTWAEGRCEPETVLIHGEKVVVLIDHQTLVGQVRGTGQALSGDVLSPEVVRRMACDASIIPVVLGATILLLRKQER